MIKKIWLLLNQENPEIAIELVHISGVTIVSSSRRTTEHIVTVEGDNHADILAALDEIEKRDDVGKIRYVEFSVDDALHELQHKQLDPGITLKCASEPLHDNNFNENYFELLVEQRGKEEKWKVTDGRWVEVLPLTEE